MLETNNWIPFGTDFPVEDINPVYTFYVAVARKDLKGYPDDGFQVENALSREEALKGMTIWAAKAAFEENVKGSIEAGKFADFIILQDDIMQCELAEIPDNKVEGSYLNGQKVY